MKTLEELYKEVQGNEELKKEFIAAFKEGRLEEFLKSQNSDAGIYRCIQRRQAGGIPEKSEQRRGTGGRGGILKRNQRRDCIGR